MDNKPIFSISVSPDIPVDERESLILALRSIVDIEQPTSRFTGLEWLTFIAFMKDLGVLAGTATALVKLANEIKTWRKNIQKRGVKADVKLKQPNKEELDLTNATDDEVDEWLLK
jgi:hypothetical protein